MIKLIKAFHFKSMNHPIPKSEKLRSIFVQMINDEMNAHTLLLTQAFPNNNNK